MSNVNNAEVMKNDQYHTSKNLDTRVMLHQLYSTNKTGWTNWIFQHYEFKANQQFLELGCGNGAVWSAGINKIPSDVKIVLSDFSQGMLSAAQQKLNGLTQIEYQVIDAQDICYEDNSFDVVIANHMLYHVPDLNLALREIARVLKPDGVFYASTIGNNNMHELDQLLLDFDPQIDFAHNSVTEAFGLENGKEKLGVFFDQVELDRYKDGLHITEVQPLVDYVMSSDGIGNVTEVITGDRINEFHNFVADRFFEKGFIDISKYAGIFIASKPKKTQSR